MLHPLASLVHPVQDHAYVAHRPVMGQTLTSDEQMAGKDSRAPQKGRDTFEGVLKSQMSSEETAIQQPDVDAQEVNEPTSTVENEDLSFDRDPAVDTSEDYSESDTASLRQRTEARGVQADKDPERVSFDGSDAPGRADDPETPLTTTRDEDGILTATTDIQRTKQSPSVLQSEQIGAVPSERIVGPIDASETAEMQPENGPFVAASNRQASLEGPSGSSVHSTEKQPDFSYGSPKLRLSSASDWGAGKAAGIGEARTDRNLPSGQVLQVDKALQSGPERDMGPIAGTSDPHVDRDQRTQARRFSEQNEAAPMPNRAPQAALTSNNAVGVHRRGEGDESLSAGRTQAPQRGPTTHSVSVSDTRVPHLGDAAPHVSIGQASVSRSTASNFVAPGSVYEAPVGVDFDGSSDLGSLTSRVARSPNWNPESAFPTTNVGLNTKETALPPNFSAASVQSPAPGMNLTVAQNQHPASGLVSTHMQVAAPKPTTHALQANLGRLAFELAGRGRLEPEASMSQTITYLGPSEVRQIRAAAPSGLASPDLPKHVAQQLAQALQNSADRQMELVLKPAELGRVRMSLTPAETGIVVNIFAERPETLELMRRNVDLLAQDFRDVGYESAEFAFGQDRSNQTNAEIKEQTDQDNVSLSATPSAVAEMLSDSQSTPVVSLDRVDLRV